MILGGHEPETKTWEKTTMGLGSFTEEGEEESSSANKSTYVTFKNPTQADVNEKSAHRHKQEYYDAAKFLRNKLGQDVNVLVGEFMVAAEEAESGDAERLEGLFNRLAGDEE